MQDKIIRILRWLARFISALVLIVVFMLALGGEIPSFGNMHTSDLFMFIGLIIITIIALNLIDYAVTAVYPLIGMKVANTIAILMFWTLAYFAFISYALVPHKMFKQTFILGIKQWKELLPVHVAATLILVLATAIPAILMTINPYLPLVFGILISLPALAWTRVLWVTAIQKVTKT